MCSECDRIMNKLLANAVTYTQMLLAFTVDELNVRFETLVGETDAVGVEVRVDIVGELHRRALIENEFLEMRKGE